MWHNLVNTALFQEAATDFRKNGGRYTTAPRGSRDYTEYWKIQEERCRIGYKCGDVWIPGRYYFYLNFFPMWKVPNEVALKAFEERRDSGGRVSKRTADKILDFPRFNEMQYEWWMFKHIAWHGGTFMGINSPGGKHVCCGKTRGAGFSYMEAADGVYNYNFIPGSKSYYFAAQENYLTKDGILVKVQEGLDWINQYSPRWLQNRHEKNTLMHQKASYIDEVGNKKGSKSEIMGVIVNDPNKTRGKRGKKITFEEAGSFKNLKTALEISMGSLRDGDLYVGQCSVFGTGGDQGESLEGLEDIFYNPHAWDMLAFPNVWEDGGYTECGFFVPSYRANFVYTDKDGNIDYQAAVLSDEAERDKKRNSQDPKNLDRRKGEYPQKPSEMFNRLDNNGFDIYAIDKQIKRVQSDNKIQSLMRYGRFIRSEGDWAINGVEFVVGTKMDMKPIEEYPHKHSDDLTGCITIVEKPFIDQSGSVPTGMYQLVFDAYYKDDAEDRTSLFDFRVFKQDNNISPTFTRLPVAWGTMRPARLATCYEQLFMMCDYFNCTAQGEISGGGKGVLDYAKAKQLLHRMEFEPEMLHNTEIATRQKNRSYLMNMTADRKKMGMTYLEQWHVEPIGMDEDGNTIRIIDKIYDIGLLRELRKGGINNSDRMSSCLIAMFMLKEHVIKTVRATTENDYFFDRVLFAENSSQETTSLY